MNETKPAAAPRRRIVAGLVAALLLIGLGLRLRYLGEGTLFIDEAESSLNALSILEHGYPADHYLGLPMFENTLTRPWPEHEEYEFRDSSYSSRGKAIYHGWLPLYAMAASLALHGVRPDRVTSPPRVQHDAAEIQTRIRAARLPSVLFGLLFLWALFLLGRTLAGDDAGLAALATGTFLPKCIWLSQQARYYSAALALSTLAAHAAWMVFRHGRWRDFLLAGLAGVLLFHTSSLALAIALLASVVLLPGILRHEKAPAKLAAWCLVMVAGILPWMLWTGYLEPSAAVPMARDLLDFPSDYFLYLRGRPGRVLAGVLVLAVFALAWLGRRRLPQQLSSSLHESAMPVLFLSSWVLVAFFGFQAVVPAASLSMTRLSHVLLAGQILLGAVVLTTALRALVPRGSTWIALSAPLFLLLADQKLLRWQRRNPFEATAVLEVVDHLRGLDLTDDTRIYALPYQHFCLTYYTGLPIQSIAPVRREFLERYPGEILILETACRLPTPPAGRVRDLAGRAGVELDEAEAEWWVPRLHELMVRAEIAPLVRRILPEAEDLAPWAGPLAAALTEEAVESGQGSFDYSLDNPAMFTGLPPLTFDEFWPAFFYRFAGAAERSGARLNYAGRMHEAEALVLSSSWVVLRCPRRAAEPAG